MSIPQPINLLSRVHEHTGSLHDLIASLERQLTASSIMTPWSMVASIEAESNAAEVKARATELMARHHYSGVPMVTNGRVKGVFVRRDVKGKTEYEGVRAEHFVTPQTGLIELIRHMRDTGKVVVGVGTSEVPQGWLTYADFSRRPFRVLLFAILAEVEYLLAEVLDHTHPDGSWIELLPINDPEQNARKKLEERRQEAIHYDSIMPLTTFAEIGHLITALNASPAALAFIGESSDLAPRLRSIPELRNRVAHVVKPVISGPGTINSTCAQIDMMLGWIQSWSARLNSPERGTNDHV